MVFYKGFQPKNRRKHPRQEANIFSILTLSWLLPLLKRGWRQELKEEDVFQVLEQHKCQKLGHDLERNWTKELERNQPSLIRAMLKTFGIHYMFVGLLCFINSCLTSVYYVYLMSWFVACFDESQEEFPLRSALTYGLGFVAVMTAGTMCFNASVYQGKIVGMKASVALSYLLYKKVLRLPQIPEVSDDTDPDKLAQGNTTGQLINIMTNDLSRLPRFLLFLHYLWVSPIQFVEISVAVWFKVGYATLAGTMLCLLLAAATGILGVMVGKVRRKVAMKSDSRISLMNEIIENIRTIKVNAWEYAFKKLIEGTREEEMEAVRKRNRFTICTSTISHAGFKLVYLAIIASAVLTGSQVLAADDIFFAIGCYFLINRNGIVTWLPLATFFASELHVSMSRVEGFLLSGELAGTKVHEDKDVGVAARSVCVKRDPVSTNFTLKDCSFTMEKGQLCIVTGPVGCGKTSLLEAISGELAIDAGHVKVCGKTCFLPQQPWIFTGSVRSNIVLDAPIRDVHYQNITQMCALHHDFEQWDFGDATLVGERGIALSGGQRARIALARAMYHSSESDVFVMDDPFSAVDGATAHHIFHNCIRTHLREKTVIVSTYQHEFLPDADKIIVMEERQIKHAATFQNLPEHLKTETTTAPLNTGKLYEARGEKSTSRPQVPSETKKEGNVSMDTYKKYIRSAGTSIRLSLILLLSVITQALFNVVDVFIGYWVDKTGDDISGDASVVPGMEDRYFYLLILTCLTFALFLTAELRNTEFFAGTVRASKQLHNEMFWKILRSPTSFFDYKPVGIVLTRFSKDLGIADEHLPTAMLSVLSLSFSTAGVLITTSVYMPMMIIPSLIMSIILHMMRKVFMTVSRPLMRLQGVMKAPVLSQVSDTVHGLGSIRTFRIDKTAISEFCASQDTCTSTEYLTYANTSLFSAILDLSVVIYDICIVLLFTLWQSSNSLGGDVGVVMMGAMLLINIVMYGILESAEMENMMTSTERVLQYTELKTEAPLHTRVSIDKSQWPWQAEIKFNNVSVQYSDQAKNDDDKAVVLEDINVAIKGGEKIGIVGRTGAGKSTLVATLFRLVEPFKGTIEINGIDMSQLGLFDLRRLMSIIPQTPQLFSGTLRFNLDPGDEHNDEEIWRALDAAHLMDFAHAASQGIHTKIQYKGSNLSDGEKQLICLARALLSRNKIIVLDEATSNIDPGTDQLIQKTIKEGLKEHTMLIIAHRLSTILDSDRIIVMSKGRIKTVGQPNVLLGNRRLLEDEIKNLTSTSEEKAPLQ